MCNLVLLLFWLSSGTAHAEENITLNAMSRFPSTHVFHIAPNCVAVPTGSLLLAKKATTICAVILTRAWKDGSHEFAEYESYYGADASGHFQKKTVKIMNGQLSFPDPRGIGRFAFSFGNKDISFRSVQAGLARRQLYLLSQHKSTAR
jgi:hypothetical protein